MVLFTSCVRRARSSCRRGLRQCRSLDPVSEAVCAAQGGSKLGDGTCVALAQVVKTGKPGHVCACTSHVWGMKERARGCACLSRCQILNGSCSVGMRRIVLRLHMCIMPVRHGARGCVDGRVNKPLVVCVRAHTCTTSQVDVLRMRPSQSLVTMSWILPERTNKLSETTTQVSIESNL
jgi:hypothetical protein